MNNEEILDAATYLLNATLEAKEVDRISSRFQSFSLEESYKVQRQGMLLRQERGAKFLGWKMGLTSEAKRKQMNLDSAIFGYLHDEGLVSSSSFSFEKLIHPKIEPEIGFRMKKTIQGKISFDEAADAIESVAAACEIIDSRFIGFKYFSLPDVVADNCSASHYVWGPEVKNFDMAKLGELKMELLLNNEVVQSAMASEISDHPLHSVMQLSELLAKEGRRLEAGTIVLAGAATTAVSLEHGQSFELKVDSLPSVKIRIL